MEGWILQGVGVSVAAIEFPASDFPWGRGAKHQHHLHILGGPKNLAPRKSAQGDAAPQRLGWETSKGS